MKRFKLKVGDRVRLVDAITRSRYGYFNSRIHEIGAEGTVAYIEARNIEVKWDNPYSGSDYSGMRRGTRFELVGGPW